MIKSTLKFVKLGVVEKLHISKHSTSFGPEENQIFFKQTASKIYGTLDALQDKCTPLSAI